MARGTGDGHSGLCVVGLPVSRCGPGLCASPRPVPAVHYRPLTAAPRLNRPRASAVFADSDPIAYLDLGAVRIVHELLLLETNGMSYPALVNLLQTAAFEADLLAQDSSCMRRI